MARADARGATRLNGSSQSCAKPASVVTARRKRGLIAPWRAGLRIYEVLALTQTPRVITARGDLEIVRQVRGLVSSEHGQA